MSPSESPVTALDTITMPDRRESELLTATSLFAVSALELLLGGTALVFSCLRETHEFWLNAGGYPILLRDIVLVCYYPLMILNFCTLIGLAFTLCAKPGIPRGFLKFQLFMMCFGWTLWGASVAVSARNNVANFLEDRPLHDKAEEEIR